MGRGLSKLQRLILGEAGKRDVVLFEEVCAMLCPDPEKAAIEAIMNADCEHRGDLCATFASLARQRRSRPHIWESAKETTQEQNMPGIAAGFKAYEQAEKKRPVVEASVSRAFTRLEQRGLVERVNVSYEDDQGNRFQDRYRRGVRLTVNSDKAAPS